MLDDLEQLEEEFDVVAARAAMMKNDLAGRDITDARVLEAMQTVPRHRFLPVHNWDEAYADHPVVIDCGQTISQPYIVAFMTQALRVESGMRVLEIGTGSGYQAAVLAAMGAQVFTVERHEPLSHRAQETLRACGLAESICFRVGDGTLGWPQEAPYDRIIVTAAAPVVPEALCSQLADGGRMILPVGPHGHQVLKVVTRRDDSYKEKELLDVLFVPLIGEQGCAE